MLKIRQMLYRINHVLTTINGFIFGLLGGFSPLHTKVGHVKSIPLFVNVALLLVLALVLYTEIRVGFY
jgi:hypothetical protein